ncbi:MAG: signal peptide peptidase SppA [Myxococcales bacterium]|nr:signal peptide peptidase SppA [Myxococcales bacterium]
MRRSTRRGLVSGALLAALAVSSEAGAQGFDPPRIQPPTRSLAGTDDTDAIGLVPAQLAFLPGWELRWTHVHLPKGADTLTPARGDAIGFGLPLFFGLSTGVRVESVRPPESTPSPSLWSVNWALAWKLSEVLSYALDLRFWLASDPLLERLDGAVGLGASFALRPSRFAGFSFAARDLNAPKGVHRSFVSGFAIRPLGTRTFEIGVDGSWNPLANQRFGLGGTLGVDVPFGRASVAFRMGDPNAPEGRDFANAWSLTAGVEVGLLTTRLGGGIVAGKNLGGDPGWYATASIGGFKQPGIPETDRAVLLRIEDTPGSRGHVHLLRKLARLGRDPTVRAVALVIKADAAGSTAHAEELADALDALQKKGIKVLCHLEDGGAKSLLACSAADKVLVNPAGGIRFAGFRTQTMYYGTALQKIGVEPDFIRIKEHKGAPEAFVRDGPTPQAAANQKELLAAIERIYLERLAKGKGMSVETVRANIAKGPFVADEAIAAGLVHEKAFDDEVKAHVHKLVGKKLRVEADESEPVAPKTFGKRPRIAIVYLDGDIVDGRSQRIPLLGTKLVGSYTVAEALDAARTDPSIAGVVLRIESPGGSSLASDVMWREAERLSKVKPVVVSMGSVAASGGYYAAAFGAPIYANAGTVTGSIGIFYGKADVSGLLGKLGVTVVTEKTAPKADAESLYRPFTDEERVELGKKVAQFYAVFLDRVARGRKMTVDQVDAVAHGKVWLGLAAKEKGLVDHVGGLDAALADVRARAGLEDDAPVSEFPQEKNGLLDVALDLLGAEAPVPNAAALPKAIAPYVDALAPFAVYGPDQPLALWEGIGTL